MVPDWRSPADAPRVRRRAGGTGPSDHARTDRPGRPHRPAVPRRMLGTLPGRVIERPRTAANHSRPAPNRHLGHALWCHSLRSRPHYRGGPMVTGVMASVSVRYIVDEVAAAIAFYCDQLDSLRVMHPAHNFRNVGSRRVRPGGRAIRPTPSTGAAAAGSGRAIDPVDRLRCRGPFDPYDG